MEKLWFHNFYFKNRVISRRPGVVNMADIITLNKPIFKNSIKPKIITNLITRVKKKILISGEKCWYQQNLSGALRDFFVYFLNIL